MKFIDEARIWVKAGDGGNGAATFRREKYVPDGGPDGGDGGRGGHIIFRVDPGLNTLQEFRKRRRFRAENGEHGKSSNRAGRNGKDCIIEVPLGTLVKEMVEGEDSPRVLADLTHELQEVVVARGGRGGRGNARFKSSVRQAPRFAELGEPGEERQLELELKVLADVGIIGFPNAGKSTFLSHVSAARPKIADYPFTTLTPQLGVVSHRETSWVMADIPGLIEGAHQGVGLGDAFLRHIERTRLLLHLVDVSPSSDRDPVEAVQVINRELAAYSLELAKKPQIVAANKIDLLPEDEKPTLLAPLKKWCEENDVAFFAISAVSGQGIAALLDEMADRLSTLPEQAESPSITAEKVYRAEEPEAIRVEQLEDDTYRVSGKRVERLVAMTNLENEEAIRYLHRRLVRLGVMEELEKRGIMPGDTVRIGEMEFEYQP